MAAGQGVRAGAGEPKQFRPIAGVPMLLRALRPFSSHPDIGDIVVVLPPTAAAEPPEFLSAVGGGRVHLIAGGASRQASVRKGLDALSSAHDVVLIHDAARPFVSRDTIDAVITAARRGVGALAAVPVGDTLRRAMPGAPTETVSREHLWRAQTPQGFPVAPLRDAFTHQNHRLDQFTDDAALWEAAGHSLVLVEDRTTNIKITTPDDFMLAEAIARSE